MLEFIGQRLLLAIGILAGVGNSAGAQGVVDFRRDIRPLLATQCFACHGPDEKQRQAELRLDTPVGLRKSIKPGKSQQSELIRRIMSDDPDEVMPPPSSKRTLSTAQKEALRDWIDSGANWDEHWAFERLSKPEPPRVSKPAAPIRNPIDAFVQHRLQQSELTPSEEAPRHVLIRRLSLDLTGLPPSPQELEEYLRDQKPGAYERLVERLLKSPAFGERMAWDWLDAARYADSNGYQGDRERTMWPWRDWVVRAFNDNLSYRDFTIWQLAGDLLPNPTFDQRLATGFCRNHMINGEGGRIPEENRIDYVMDMTETMGTVWLGLTLNCCRCHDHKFDPLSQREYYSLFAFFNQTPVTGAGGNPQTPPILPAPTKAQEHRLQELTQEIQATERRITARQDELRDGQMGWEEKQGAGQAAKWKTLPPLKFTAEHQTLRRLEDDSLLASGANPDNDTYAVVYSLTPGRMASFRLEAMRHKSLTSNSLSRAESGNFVLTGIEFRLRDSSGKIHAIPIAQAAATFEQGALKIAGALDKDPRTGWAVYQGRVVDRPHAALFRLAEPVSVEPGSQLLVTLRHNSPHKKHNLGRFRVSASQDAKVGLSSPKWFADLATPAAKRTPEQAKRIREVYWKSDSQLTALGASRDGLRKQVDGVRSSLAKVMIMQDQAKPRSTYILTRGLYNKPGEQVTAITPAALAPFKPSGRPNRLELARWIVSDANPLTARVTVNRFWQKFFGVGLAKTTEDFGIQGETPPHRRLLDWLAVSFRESGWDVKDLIRTIVSSHTYRQASVVTPAHLQLDKDNRLLSRGPRYRLPAWMLRDQALAVSGLLADQLGGPPVNGYQPAGVWEEATFGKKKYLRDSGAALYRRSLYTFWRRIIAPTMFFDNASRQTCTVKPFRTNTPLHALLTLNDVTYVEAARALAERVLAEHPRQTSDAGKRVANQAQLSESRRNEARLNAAFLRVLCRPANDAEREVLLGGLARTKRAFAASPNQAASLLAIGESPRDKSLNLVEHASWTALCLALLNLDETLSKE